MQEKIIKRTITAELPSFDDETPKLISILRSPLLRFDVDGEYFKKNYMYIRMLGSGI
jgi:hypothetical protein